MKNLLILVYSLCLFSVQAQVKKTPNNPKDIGMLTDGRKTVFQEMKEREVALRNVKAGGLTSQGNAKVFSKINPTKLGDYVSDWLPASDCFLGIYFKVKMKGNKDGTYDTTIYFKNNYNKEVYFNSSVIGNNFEKKYQPYEQFPEHMNIGFKENKLKAGQQSSSTTDSPYINFNNTFKDLNIKITIFDVCFYQHFCTKNSSGYNPNGVDNGNKNAPCYAICDKGSPNIPQKCGKGSDTTETKKVNTNDGSKGVKNSSTASAFSEQEWQSLVNQYEELRGVEHSLCLKNKEQYNLSDQEKNKQCPIYKDGNSFEKSSWGINKLKSEVKGLKELIQLWKNTTQ